MLLSFANAGLARAMCAYAETTSGPVVETWAPDATVLAFEPDGDGFAGARVPSPPGRCADQEAVSLGHVRHRDAVAAP